MAEGLSIKRTSSADPGFQLLVSCLDHELWNELKEDQAKYDQYNKVPDIETVIVIYLNERPVACGCFKKYNEDTVEIKRMFVEKKCRGKGFSKLVLEELEHWAVESGFHYSILETSIHFNRALNLYSNAGYQVIENYDQYKGLEESICMKKELARDIKPSEFKGLPDVEYFLFEEDFVERNMRCIPLIVRFKMDRVGIKLRLSEWSKFSVEERIELAKRSCDSEEEAALYRSYLAGLVSHLTGKEPSALVIDENPEWDNLYSVPGVLNKKLAGFGWRISDEKWKGLSRLQRFALLKLCKEGHENKNLPKAMKEFGLVEG